MTPLRSQFIDALRVTMLYLHVSTALINATVSPLDVDIDILREGGNHA